MKSTFTLILVLLNTLWAFSQSKSASIIDLKKYEGSWQSQDKSFKLSLKKVKKKIEALNAEIDVLVGPLTFKDEKSNPRSYGEANNEYGIIKYIIPDPKQNIVLHVYLDLVDDDTLVATIKDPTEFIIGEKQSKTLPDKIIFTKK
ncbi:DUF6705 family protein [Arsenicibacter rosenii]|uniref:DUF6705 domain-containing protein n=1 Tax=Arsenicibacter rosenii TaxID=1750698 RepID=A0A1S2VH54_9BACT|nr:DUF6705 family protein [Arsenicibacter rosenii]OIN57565.1 hypothetical protein BLX24_18950 [Arsenicibacter rosenii]